MDKVYILNYLVSTELNKGKGKMVAFFVDLREVFDFGKGKLCKALRESGIREGLVQRCENLLRETNIGEKSSEVFCTGRRVKQGCPVSPGLFNILTADLEEIMKKGG